MDNQELQNSVAKIAETLITTQRNLVTVSRSLWAVRISIRELHPDFEEMYLNHFAEPEHAFDIMRDSLLDSGSDETILDPSVAPLIGVDLSQALEREINLIGRGRIRCRYASVQLRITDGVAETYEWDTIVGFAPFPVLRNLLGFAGFLQFFDVQFRGAAQEAILLPNALFPGQRI